jgi:thiosulfate dehydrogenase [quinone] large subunit
MIESSKTSVALNARAPRGPLEYTAAFLLLRLFLGLRTLLAGVDKFELGGVYSTANYAKNMGRMADGITSASFLPLWMTKLFAGSLGYVLLAVGVALLLGLKTRLTLVLTGLVYLALAFGLMAVQEDQGVAWLGVHVVLVAGALLLVRYDRFALWPDRHE